jgi:DNA relaxase NicK
LIRSAFGSAGEMLTFSSGIDPKDGWKYAGELLMGGDIQLGRVDYGGDSQLGWVRLILTGEGCAWVQDWPEIQRLGVTLVDGDVRRLDVALTVHNGEINHNMLKAAHVALEFKGAKGGRNPEMEVIEKSNIRTGQTVYIGSRKSPKYLRGYDKGFEMLKDCADRENITHIGPDLVENIYRVEVEFKAVDDYYIPWTAIEERDEFFAGAYPFCSRVIGLVSERKISAIPDFKPVVLMDKALENCRISYGNILRTALEAFGGDKLAVIERVLGDSHSDALVRAGVLTVSHPV